MEGEVLEEVEEAKENAIHKNNLPQIFGDDAFAEIGFPGVVDNTISK